jgi:hypothetical protein
LAGCSPAARIASISPSADMRPKAMSEATRTDMGTESASIQAAFRMNNSMTTRHARPLVRIESRIWTTKSTRKSPVMTTRE